MDINRYTANNATFLVGNTLVYDYYYENITGERYVFEEVLEASELPWQDRRTAWFFVHKDSLTSNSIAQVILKVKYGLEPLIQNNPHYNQTVISYYYPQENGVLNFRESTGVIENSKNVWMHPPREKMFMLLELNPFPFLRVPHKIGNKWEWSLKIGSFWGDKRWKTWEGSIENKCFYEITNIKTIKTAFGNLACIEVNSIAKSRLGETGLVSYYHDKYGFVKLEYTNIDSTKIVLELVSFDQN